MAGNLSDIQGNSKAILPVLRMHIRILATFIPLFARVVPLKILVDILTPPFWFKPYHRITAAKISELVQLRLENPRNMKRRSCLRLSLVLFHFLRLAGEPAEIHFSVYPPGIDSTRMHGHCWVTNNGENMCEPPADPHTEVWVKGG